VVCETSARRGSVRECVPTFGSVDPLEPHFHGANSPEGSGRYRRNLHIWVRSFSTCSNPHAAIPCAGRRSGRGGASVGIGAKAESLTRVAEQGAKLAPGAVDAASRTPVSLICSTAMMQYATGHVLSGGGICSTCTGQKPYGGEGCVLRCSGGCRCHIGSRCRLREQHDAGPACLFQGHDCSPRPAGLQSGLPPVLA
jgi:hypothetical protein